MAERFLLAALAILAGVFALHWAWELLRPLLLPLGLMASIVGLIILFWRRRTYW